MRITWWEDPATFNQHILMDLWIVDDLENVDVVNIDGERWVRYDDLKSRVHKHSNKEVLSSFALDILDPGDVEQFQAYVLRQMSMKIAEDILRKWLENHWESAEEMAGKSPQKSLENRQKTAADSAAAEIESLIAEANKKE